MGALPGSPLLAGLKSLRDKAFPCPITKQAFSTCDGSQYLSKRMRKASWIEALRSHPFQPGTNTPNCDHRIKRRMWLFNFVYFEMLTYTLAS